MTLGRPPAEIDVTPGLVRELLRAQHPDLAGLPLRVVATGWDNVLVRLGDELVVRLPRRQLGADLVEHEQAWLPRLAPLLPLPVPVPVRTGAPGLGYPWSWSICRWLPGTDALTSPPEDPAETAHALGAVLRVLRAHPTDGAPDNPYRGRPLATRDETTRERLDAVGDRTGVDPGRVLRCWEAALAVPAWGGEPVLLHGDLHPGNLLVRDGHLSAVLDFGDLTAGDPAADLSVAWMLLPAPERSTLRAVVGDVDDDQWARARGWAVALALAYLTAVDDERMTAVGRRTLAEVLADG